MKILGKTIHVTPSNDVKIILVIDKSFYDPEMESVEIQKPEYVEAALPSEEEFTLYDVFEKYKDVAFLGQIFVINDWPFEGTIYKIENNGGAIEYATTRGYA
ncbi:hypothetical protein LFYK43_14170 [Ligilactobacillus salitolerans]|uniref:Uncharacterized protein n=1 Tax=Ligilactobacillus salitolerans TaxID=1808352 RepID=A0A401ITX9_9LACO|nr:hypothetical protein LFYK43_14170 [Ligilactobacillus salitolerans]